MIRGKIVRVLKIGRRMVNINDAAVLNNELQKGKKFYLYGAGQFYKRIIRAVQNDIIAVIDKKYSSIEPLNDMEIIAPTQLFSNNSPYGVVSGLNPFFDYIKRTEQLAEELEQYNVDIDLYMLDVEKIIDCGILSWGKRELLYDNITYLISGYSDFVRKAYLPEVIADRDYLNKLYEEPHSYVIYGNGIGLEDFDNGFIKHLNGRKDYYDNDQMRGDGRVLLFGDSRVSGFLLENRHTIAAFLKKRLKEIGLQFEILNYAIPGRDIERMVWQIENTEISQNDIVILGTGFYEYDNKPDENVYVWIEYIEEAFACVKKRGASFVYINLPTIMEMAELSKEEAEAVSFFTKTEFMDYSSELIEYYKGIIQIECATRGIIYLDATQELNKRKKYGQVFINLHHYGPAGCKCIGDMVSDYIRVITRCRDFKLKKVTKKKKLRSEMFNEKLNKMKIEDSHIDFCIDALKRKIEQKWKHYGNLGCIVMNANPFTFGHMFLVEKALEIVDKLLVLVVSEEGDAFSFNDRFNMVRENLADINRVLVLPSGEYCISKSTFPEYFNKDMLQGKTINMDIDASIFVHRLAPALGITKRFVGDEPFDSVTMQYNNTMKRIFEGSSVELIEIEREKHNGRAISASFVRKLISDKRWNEIVEYVPKATYEYLRCIEGD